jgi:hypothetical protein
MGVGAHQTGCVLGFYGPDNLMEGHRCVVELGISIKLHGRNWILDQIDDGSLQGISLCSMKVLDNN